MTTMKMSDPMSRLRAAAPSASPPSRVRRCVLRGTRCSFYTGDLVHAEQSTSWRSGIRRSELWNLEKTMGWVGGAGFLEKTMNLVGWDLALRHVASKWNFWWEVSLHSSLIRFWYLLCHWFRCSLRAYIRTKSQQRISIFYMCIFVVFNYSTHYAFMHVAM